MSKTALITGASSGIGREIAKQLSSRGFRVILAARRKHRLEELAEELDGESRVVTCDLSTREGCFDLYEQVKDERVSVLINNAGFGAIGNFEEIPLETELRMIDTNVTAVHILTKLFVKDFIKADRGYILNVASSAGLMAGGPLMAAYYATKAYVVSLTGSVNRELKNKGANVHISALCPGPVDTEFNEVAGCEFGVGAISAEECARTAVEGLFRKSLIIVPGTGMKAAATLSKIVPREMVLKVAGEMQKRKTK
ncbi:MAG: SDR family oxidoreductase [Ruminococcus sp.]|nr:SDR family oxidoreductase [Ruminococcus sp.]